MKRFLGTRISLAAVVGLLIFGLALHSAEAIYLKTAERAEIRVPRTSVESIKQSRQSIMPQGLEAQMSRQELRDLLAYLKSLK